jgi:hypothetical protein
MKILAVSAHRKKKNISLQSILTGLVFQSLHPGEINSYDSMREDLPSVL